MTDCCRTARVDELRRMAAEFDERAGPDSVYGGLEEATWSWAADHLRERATSLEARR